MARSGVKVSAELKELICKKQAIQTVFLSIEDGAFIECGIKNDDGSFNHERLCNEDLKKKIEEINDAVFVIHDYNVGGTSKKDVRILIFMRSDASSVKKKMVFASSVGALRSTIGESCRLAEVDDFSEVLETFRDEEKKAESHY